MAQRPSADEESQWCGYKRLGRRPANRSSPSPTVAEGRSSAYAGGANRQRGAFAWGAGNGDRSPVFLDNLLDGREAQAGSGSFRRKERLEDLIKNFSRNGGAVVLDQD